MISLQPKSQQVTHQCRQIRSEVRHLDALRAARTRKFEVAIEQYRTYVRKENELLDRNFQHCEQRNKWYREQVDLSWKNAIANRPAVLRSVARTNVLKKDLDDWLQRLDPHLAQQEQEEEASRSLMQEEHLQGSKLIDKYNQILLEYGHRV